MVKAAYYVIDVNINNQEKMQPYQARVGDTLRRFGGRLVVAGASPEPLEGRAPQGLIVIVEFPSMEQAHAWHESPEYQAIIGYRHAAAESHAFLVEGVAGAMLE